MSRRGGGWWLAGLLVAATLLGLVNVRLLDRDVRHESADVEDLTSLVRALRVDAAAGRGGGGEGTAAVEAQLAALSRESAAARESLDALTAQLHSAAADVSPAATAAATAAAKAVPVSARPRDGSNGRGGGGSWAEHVITAARARQPEIVLDQRGYLQRYNKHYISGLYGAGICAPSKCGSTTLQKLWVGLHCVSLSDKTGATPCVSSEDVENANTKCLTRKLPRFQQQQLACTNDNIMDYPLISRTVMQRAAFDEKFLLAAIVREPLSRLFSAVRNKCLEPPSELARIIHCPEFLGLPAEWIARDGGVPAFEYYVLHHLRNQTNGHFTPQAFTDCGLYPHIAARRLDLAKDRRDDDDERGAVAAPHDARALHHPLLSRMAGGLTAPGFVDFPLELNATFTTQLRAFTAAVGERLDEQARREKSPSRRSEWTKLVAAALPPAPAPDAEAAAARGKDAMVAKFFRDPAVLATALSYYAVDYATLPVRVPAFLPAAVASAAAAGGGGGSADGEARLCCALQDIWGCSPVPCDEENRPVAGGEAPLLSFETPREVLATPAIRSR